MPGVVAWSLTAVSAAVVLVQGVLAHTAARARPVCPADDDEPLPWPARALATFRLLARECAATVYVALSVPLAWVRDPPPRRASQPLVVLVHGFAQHRGVFAVLARRLRRDGWPVHALGYRAVGRTVEQAADDVAMAIARIRRESGARTVDVVAHGIGGLVVRAVLRRSPVEIRRVVTLGTAHQGTLAFHLLRALDPMLADMEAGSPFLRRLAAEDPVPGMTDFVAIHSAEDALVVPPTCGYYPGAFNVELQDTGHGALLVSRRVYELVRENLAADDAAAASGR